MNLKLFIVMGISWALENISYWDWNDVTHIFYLSDLANALQGLFIFGIFILKKRVLKNKKVYTNIRKEHSIRFMPSQRRNFRLLSG
ncbi:unnamed protein product [Nesidiocoris tenuis]|uniref:Uncharacterized protein n=1 Tax=Nesidiocoris tenuis TaxID=355587 RepID=A0A6H5HF01_9HEMI|nr:unnamed protein product [Nesidiocoris tenuis]